MDKILKQEVAKYIFPFHANTAYNNEVYLNNLIKKYGRKTVLEAISEESKHGNIYDAFTYPD